MSITEAMNTRHSVRQYTDKALGEGVVLALKEEIDACNRESGLHIQLVTNEPKAFDGFMAHYGKFSGVTNYIAMIGKKGPTLEETCGYYGERLVLFAQQHLLGGDDLQQNQNRVCTEQRRKAVHCDCTGVWCNAGCAPQVQNHTGCGKSGRTPARLVSGWRQSGLAGTYGHESAEIHLFPDR